MVVATEGGLPVPVTFEAIQVFNVGAASFQELGEAEVTNVENGVYIINVEQGDSPVGTIFKFRVRHDDTKDRYGQVVFNGKNTSRQLPEIISCDSFENCPGP